jgi:hypothetical protein
MSKRWSILIVAVVFALLASCAPSDPPPPAANAAPNPAEETPINEMDFESGEVEEQNAEPDPPVEDETP